MKAIVKSRCDWRPLDDFNFYLLIGSLWLLCCMENNRRNLRVEAERERDKFRTYCNYLGMKMTPGTSMVMVEVIRIVQIRCVFECKDNIFY